ncbi:aminopeptidase P family protein [Clostridium sp. BJN0001]|uniref:aminopeptidase P family protein n=1 Tax=Clostridium sp. BJN0001 TaxID=2930219 RepID=UPI001FD32717|nr:aminopeptidase P family protein [Clostridium sp. BJN0001]
MKSSILEKHRKDLLESIDGDFIAVIFSGSAPKKSADEFYAYTPNRNFYYLTGIAEENHIFVLYRINKCSGEKLFLHDINEQQEAWTGKTLRDYEAREISGIDDVSYMSEFDGFIKKYIKSSDTMNIYLDLNDNLSENIFDMAHNFSKEIKNIYPEVQIRNVFHKIACLRMIKSKEEINEMRKAIEITIKGVKSLMTHAKEGLYEYQLESYFNFECKYNGAKDLAFKTIAASGKNAATLHYDANNSKVKDGELILFDLGAQYNLYDADISRTFPINGKFSKRQREIYEAVLRVNKAVIKKIKPGLDYQKLNEWSKKLIAEECIKLKLIDNIEDVSKYYWHSIGHNLGLDTHDSEPPFRKFTFKEGMVFTVEPGIYIEEEKIGIRIEDDVLVTKDGCEVLTKDMIKEVNDIEEFMKDRKF